MKNKYETAIIFKKSVDKDKNVEYAPIKIIYGTYDEKENVFIDIDGTSYYHIMEDINNYGYGYRNYIDIYKEKYSIVPNELLMKIVFQMIKKYKFTYNIDGETNTPLILFSDKNGKSEPVILLDEDMKKIYNEKYPLFAKKYIEGEKEDVTSKTENMDVSKMYKELTSMVIDQEGPISEILTPIWKQCGNVYSNKTRSILVKGGTSVGKTEIFRYLSQKLNVPVLMCSVDYSNQLYNNKCVEGMLFDLLKQANYDTDKASKGILIIDKVEKAPEVNYRNNIVSDLLRILDGDLFTLYLNVGEYTIDTSKLMVVCLFNPNELKLPRVNKIGYERTSDDNNIYDEIVEKFDNIIEMNELTRDSYIKILKSPHGTLNQNRYLLKENGVSLRIKTGTMKEMSDIAANSKNGVRSLNEIIETALAVASFEIATNPNVYSELIISPETIKDNKKYTLVKRKENIK